MKIVDLLKKESIDLNGTVSDKKETFLEMGIDELSVAPGMILPLRKRIREAD